MSCFHPLKMYLPVNFATGEVSRPKFDRSVDIEGFERLNEKIPHFLIPCGQCIGCRRDQAALWRDRLVLENSVSPEGSSWFVTLTYSDDLLPRAYTIDRETGAEGMLGVIRQDDISVWIKRIRSRLKVTGGRFFACSEYGDLTRRPHFHCLLFGFPVPDARSYLPSDAGAVRLPSGTLFSQTFQDAWRDIGGGTVTFRPADVTNIAYTAGYAIKKLRGLHEKEYQQLCEDLGVVPQPREKARMSRRPGIGVPVVLAKNARDLWRTGKIAVPDRDGAHFRNLPRIFERPCIEDAADLIERAKNNRIQYAKNARYMARLQAQCTEERLLEMQEADMQAKMQRHKPQLRALDKRIPN